MQICAPRCFVGRRLVILIVACLLVSCGSDEPPLENLDIAYVSANPPEPRHVSIQGASLDQHDQPLASAPRPDYYHLSPYVSPDGHSVVYERRVYDLGEYVGRLFVSDVDDDQQTELSNLGLEERCRLSPRGWDPTSQLVAFVCNPVEEGPFRKVGVAEVDGETSVFTPIGDHAEYTDIRFTPSGDIVVLARHEEPARSLLRIDADSHSEDERITTFEDDRFIDGLRVSPDGSEVAMIRSVETRERALRPEAEILVVDLEDGSTHALLDDEQGPTATGHHSVQGWHPDGDRLLVATGGYGRDPGPLRLIDADDDTDQTTLVEPEDLEYGTIRRADVSPDGQQVVFSDNDTDDDNPRQWNYGRMHLVETDGSNHRQFDELSVTDQVNQPVFNPTM